MTPTRPRLPIALFCLALAASVPVSAQTSGGPLRASVEGAVERPGTYEFPAEARLADAVLTGMPDRRAYPLGAALLRHDAVQAQARIRAGLLHDLDALASRADSASDLAGTAVRLREWLASLPPTGRVPNTLLEPRGLEVDPEANRPLADGDRFVYPVRPATVRVVGAVSRHCELPHVALRGAAAYLGDCPPAAIADRDWVYAVQPDGHVQRLGIAAWNRSPAYPLAPGAVVYVPLSERELRGVAPRFNRELAGFLATQPLPAAGAGS